MINWDDVIPSDLLEQWKVSVMALENVEMSLPRSYLGMSSYIHEVFVDSNKKAFGAWACAVHEDSSAFIMSKCKVAQLSILGRVNDQPTIPLVVADGCCFSSGYGRNDLSCVYGQWNQREDYFLGQQQSRVVPDTSRGEQYI